MNRKDRARLPQQRAFDLVEALLSELERAFSDGDGQIVVKVEPVSVGTDQRMATQVDIGRRSRVLLQNPGEAAKLVEAARAEVEVRRRRQDEIEERKRSDSLSLYESSRNS